MLICKRVYYPMMSVIEFDEIQEESVRLRWGWVVGSNWISAMVVRDETGGGFAGERWTSWGIYSISVYSTVASSIPSPPLVPGPS